MTNAASRTRGDEMKGSAATSGAMIILPMVSALGRFTAAGESGQCLQYELADRFECVEHAIAGDGNRFEVRNPLDPVARFQLLDEVLAGVIGIGRDARARRLSGFPPGIERLLQLADGRRPRQIASPVL